MLISSYLFGYTGQPLQIKMYLLLCLWYPEPCKLTDSVVINLSLAPKMLKFSKSQYQATFELVHPDNSQLRLRKIVKINHINFVNPKT